jgi:hypothetical protein
MRKTRDVLMKNKSASTKIVAINTFYLEEKNYEKVFTMLVDSIVFI